jgi:hypothetical protein
MKLDAVNAHDRYELNASRWGEFARRDKKNGVAVIITRFEFSTASRERGRSARTVPRQEHSATKDKVDPSDSRVHSHFTKTPSKQTIWLAVEKVITVQDRTQW